VDETSKNLSYIIFNAAGTITKQETLIKNLGGQE
jgi:hypothetical protein